MTQSNEENRKAEVRTSYCGETLSSVAGIRTFVLGEPLQRSWMTQTVIPSSVPQLPDSYGKVISWLGAIEINSSLVIHRD